MEILNQFGVQPILLAAQVVNFLILLFILKKFLYKPILKVLDERKSRIEESLKNAQEIQQKLLETEKEKEEILARASKDVEKMLIEAKKEIEAIKEEGKLQAEQLAAKIIKRGEDEARAGGERMEQAIMAKVAEIVAVGMEKVTGKSFNSKERKEMIEKTMRNLS